MINAKKSLGQHFLIDDSIANSIVDRFTCMRTSKSVLEIGPGKGVLTKYLLKDTDSDYTGVELDQRLIPILIKEFPMLEGHLYNEDILDYDFSKTGVDEWSIIGNFPYNISSQILFKVFDNREKVTCLAGMFQQEVARRIAAPPGNKEYGILSVLIQAFYDVTYWFDVGPESFSPPPKVNSGVIGLIRKKDLPVIDDVGQFRLHVKSGFGQRRKKLRNSLSPHTQGISFAGDTIFDQRAEQLSVESWIALSNKLVASKKP